MKKILFSLFLLLVAMSTIQAQKRLYTKEGVRYTRPAPKRDYAKEETRLVKKYDSYIRNGLDLIRIGEYEKAISHFQELPQVNPKVSLSRYGMIDGIYSFYRNMVSFAKYLKGDYENIYIEGNTSYSYIDFAIKYLYNDILGLFFYEAYITIPAIQGDGDVDKFFRVISPDSKYHGTIYDVDYELFYDVDIEIDDNRYDMYAYSKLQVLYLTLYAMQVNSMYRNNTISTIERRMDNNEDISTFGLYIYYRCCEREAYETSDEERRKTYLKFSEIALEKLRRDRGEPEINEIVTNKNAAAIINYMEGKWYFDNNFYDKAEKCFMKFEKVYPFIQTSVLYRSEIAEKQEYYKDAFDLYSSIRRSYFNNNQAESIRKSIVKNMELHEKFLNRLNMNGEEAEKEKDSLGSWKTFYDKYR